MKPIHFKGKYMSVSVLALPRKFQIGASILEDVLPTGSLDEVSEILAHQYPVLRHTKIFESDAQLSECSTFLLYKVVLPPVKTQG
jgi:hypothetical protein